MAVNSPQDVGPASLTAASSTTITQAITIAAGSRIYAVAVGDTGTAASATFSDNSGQGVTWTSHQALNISNFRMFDADSRQFPTGATITVTCTFSAAMSNRGMVLQEVTGADNNAVQDAQGQTQNPVSAGTDVVTTPSLTGSGAGGLCAFTRTNGGSNVSAGTGFTGGTARWTGSGDASMPEFKVTSGGSVAATWSTTAGGGAWWSVGVIFGAASAGGTGVTVDNQDTSVRRSIRRQPDQAQSLPPAQASPWVLVEPPRIVRPRRQEPQQAIPLPPLTVATSAAFAPQVDQQSTRRSSPTRPQNADVIPPLSSPSLIPLTVAPDAVRPRARRPDHLSANPIPAATRSGPAVEVQQPRRLVRSIVNAVREFIGLPALLPPPPAELKLKPPLWAVFDEVSLTAETDAVVLSATADEVTLSIESDT